MEPITNKTVKLVTGSGIVLIVVSLLGALGVLYAFLSVSQLKIWDNWFNLLFTAIFGIAVYYLAFSLLSWLFIKKKRPAAPKAK